MNHRAYDEGCLAALNRYKVARYTSEEDDLERKMKRHMSADPVQEKQRLTNKGREQGQTAGKFLGTTIGGLGGAAGGAALGSMSGHPAGTALGAILGGLGVGAAGHWSGGHLGGHMGANSGAEEYGHREEFAGRLRQLDPQTQRARIEALLRSQREAEQLQLARDNDFREDMRDVRSYTDRE